MLKSSTGARLVAIVGVDGCGKTTLLKAVRERLLARNVRFEVVWSRFNNYLSKPLLALTRLTGHNRRLTIEGVPFGYHNFERLPVYREIFAFTQAVDVNLAAWLRIYPALRRQNDLVILERGPWDTLVDVTADTGLATLGQSPIGRWIAHSVADCKAILIRRPVDQIIASRPELRHDRKLPIRARYYEDLAMRRGWRVVDNNGLIENAIDSLYRAITAE